jgi:hypothetical protein
MSLHHFHRSEYCVVVRGGVEVTVGEEAKLRHEKTTSPMCRSARSIASPISARSRWNRIKVTSR